MKIEPCVFPLSHTPKISIGMPVFNGEKYIHRALESLLAQTFTNFELIIADNASTDATEIICRDYALKDSRIQYIRHNQNYGALYNLKFVFDKAKGKYFSWAAADDFRSNDFLKKNFEYLESNSEFVASTSPNCFENQCLDSKKIDFSLTGNMFNRYKIFFNNCLQSHAIFYSLIRREVLAKCPYLNTRSYLAKDWSINLFLLSCGQIARISDGYIVFGVNGISNSIDFLKKQCNKPIERIFPLWAFSLDVISLTRSMRWSERMKILMSLFMLNMDFFEKRYRFKKYSISFINKFTRK